MGVGSVFAVRLIVVGGLLPQKMVYHQMCLPEFSSLYFPADLHTQRSKRPNHPLDPPRCRKGEVREGHDRMVGYRLHLPTDERRWNITR